MINFGVYVLTKSMLSVTPGKNSCIIKFWSTVLYLEMSEKSREMHLCIWNVWQSKNVHKSVGDPEEVQEVRSNPL